MEERKDPKGQEALEEENVPARTEESMPEEQPVPQEEYSFMQEVIKDEAGGRKFKRDAKRMAGLGLIFGIVACVSFCALQPWIEDQFGNSQAEVEIPRDEEEELTAEEGQDDPDTEEDGYRQMLNSLKSISEQAGKSVVSVTAISGQQEGSEGEGRQTSGVIVADNGQELLILGQIVTREDPGNVQVTFNDGKSYDGMVKRYDRNLGLCVYSVSRELITEDTWGAIRVAVLGSSYSVEDGEAAIVIGQPYENTQMALYGLVEGSESYADHADGHYRLISTDVEGDSSRSGVVVNTSGEVIGVIGEPTEGRGKAGLVEAYGISDIKDIIEYLSNGQDVPYIGILGSDVTEELENQGLPAGVYVDEVEADSPAMGAGIQSGDIITQINGGEVASFQAYHSALMQKQAGSSLRITCWRQGTGGEYVEINFSVTVGTKE